MRKCRKFHLTRGKYCIVYLIFLSVYVMCVCVHYHDIKSTFHCELCPKTSAKHIEHVSLPICTISIELDNEVKRSAMAWYCIFPYSVQWYAVSSQSTWLAVFTLQKIANTTNRAFFFFHRVSCITAIISVNFVNRFKNYRWLPFV